MDLFFKWITATPVAGFILLALVLVVVLLVMAAFLVAFYQGREISLWPPRLGARPFNSEKSGKNVPNAEVNHKETNRVEPNNKSSSAETRLSDEFGDVGNTQQRDRIILPSVKLSTRPIALLEGVDGSVNGTVYIILTGHRDITVGHDSSCDLPINSDLLSRHHFRLRVTLTERAKSGGRGFLFELIDSGSTNGTFLNGKHVGNPTLIKRGDLIEAGDCGFRFFTLAATGD